jgi:hypothetical protein
MFAQVTRLQYWKSEHDEETCEDAYGESIADGLFAVADGAGTTLFSNIWAKILVQSFLAVPLMSNQPFEVEWWVRRAQEQYKLETPDPGKMVWNALQKAQNQGSHSTLATLRVSKNDASRALAELVVFGDSCVLISKPGSGQVQSFPLDNPTDFEQAPICVPSKLSIFNRYFHQCRVKHVELEPGDVVALATDAVSKWIISAGNGRHAHAKDAFQELIAQTPDTWPAFISECRARDEMIDDDSTALIITLTVDALASVAPLGVTTEHSKAIREIRKKEFSSAIETGNKELIAITYGDGADLGLEGVTIPQEQVQQARRVADALREVLQVLRQEVNGPDAAAKVGPVWQKYAPFLLEESCAANLRQTLAHIGVLAMPSAQLQPQAPPSVEKQLAQSELAKLQQEREQLNLERRFVDALRADDDKAIIAAHKDIQQSLYTQNITFSPEEQQRTRLAYQREMARQRIQAALKSMNAEQMAQAYKLVSIDPQMLSLDKLELLRIANRFIDVYRTDRDEAIVSAFEEMRQPPFYQFIKLTQQENDRIELAFRRILAQQQAVSNHAANAATIPVTGNDPQQAEVPNEHRLSWLARLIRRKGAQHA